MFALTLIKTAAPTLNAAHIALVQGALERCNIRPHNRPPSWMDGKRAVRGWVLDRPNPEQMAILRGILDPHGIDAVCEAEGMPKLKLACFDMESTCIEQESLDLLGQRLGHGPEVEAITARAMNGEISINEAFHIRIKMLKGAKEEDAKAVLAQMTGFPHMKQTIAWLKSQGVRCALVTGGSQIFAAPIAEQYGFDDVVCSHFTIEDGCLDGECDILTAQGKADAALRFMDEMGIEPGQALAMGDGANDELMLNVVGRPFGWRPKPVLTRAAPNQFNHADWRALRYALT